MKSPLLCLLSFLIPWTQTTAGAPDEADWKKVDKLIEEQLPKSAVAALVPMEVAAMAEKVWPDAVRALAMRIMLESEVEADQPEQKLRRMDEAIAKAPPQMLPVLEIIAAQWYRDYFQRDPWGIQHRTPGGSGKDVAAWDARRLLAEVDARFLKALTHSAELKQIPVAHWERLLRAGELPDSYQPSLYDFLAREALAYFKTAERAFVNEGDWFEPGDDSPLMGTMEEFLAWAPGDGAAPEKRAIRIFQELMTHHRNDADPGALVLLDIERLEWSIANSAGEEGKSRALRQLAALSEKHAKHEISLRARSTLAQSLINDRKPVEARKLLLEGVAAFEKSVFAPGVRNVIRYIERRELSVSTEPVWNQAQPEIEVTCRNLKKVFFRLYLLAEKPGPEVVLKSEEKSEKTLERVRETKPVRMWQMDVPQGPEYMESRFREAAPVDLKPGLYLLAAGADEAFPQTDNLIAAARVQVTPLALVERERLTPEYRTHDGWVLDAVTGEPVSGAAVTAWQTGKLFGFNAAGLMTTGPDGFFSFQVKTTGPLCLLAEHNGLTTTPGSGHSYGLEHLPQDGREDSVILTDRAIYRPGQTIRFKGIRYFMDSTKNDYHVLPNVKRHVVLRDVNRREVAALDTVTNAFGSFSGSFTAPAQGLTGNFHLSDGSGSARINVEEYKRPKFQVEIDSPAMAPKLEEKITVKVKARAYTGAAVDGAVVRWIVGRETAWPAWVDPAWWHHSSGSNDVEIARGESTTGPDGTVEVTFTALADRSVDEKSEPYFCYRIHADVTDTAGETRSGERTVCAGYAAMTADLTVDKWQTAQSPVRISVTTMSLDEIPQAAEGAVIVHRLVPPDRVHRPPVKEQVYRRESEFSTVEQPERDLSDLNSWDSGEVVERNNIKTDEKGAAEIRVKLLPGAYRAVLETKDRFGRKVTAQDVVTVIDPEAGNFPVRIPFWVAASAWTVEPGGGFEAVWGTGYEKARAFIEIEHRGRIVERFWTEPGRTQQRVKFKVTEEHRGGFLLYVTQMRENRLSTIATKVDVPWTTKDLKLKWEHLTSKLEPGAKDTWSLSVAGPDKMPAAAELCAVLYDASLDELTPHDWSESFYGFYVNRTANAAQYPGSERYANFNQLVNHSSAENETTTETGRAWPWGLGRDTSCAGDLFSETRASRRYPAAFDPPQIPQTFGGGGSLFSFPVTPTTPASFSDAFAAADKKVPGIDLTKVGARQNMQETAFFFPHLETARDGTAKMSFTMPEAVTSWRFMGFAHDREMRSGSLRGETVTAKDLMVQPNPPRFLREGDSVEFTVKITNQSALAQDFTARLNFTDAVSRVSVDSALGIQKTEQSVPVPAKESRTVAWRITVPDGQGFVTWKAVAGNEKLTDGEEGSLPVLPRRILVTESLPLPVRDAGTKEFAFKKLSESGNSQTLRHQSLTVQMVSQPAWYAVMALPYLVEYPHECSEQTFNRFYANTLARHIAKNDPKIRRVFNLWRDAQPAAVQSPLEKNADLKSLMIEETPWLREAQKESQSNLGILFDDNRLDSEMDRLMKRLTELQMQDGAWPWFPGGPASDFITLYIVSGFGRLQHLGVEVDTVPALRALDRLDAWIADEYRGIVQRKVKDADNFGATEALYLYARSFYQEQRPVAEEQKEAVDYFLAQARKHWTSAPRMSQAHAALGLLRFGDKKTPLEILASLKERSVSNEELGLYWAGGKEQWSWNQAPVETQALMIEAFRDIAKDTKSVDDCQVWLLKQKQTQAWPTTKATADAVYALLLGGTSKLSSDALVSVSLGGKEVKPEKIEAGTGFFERKFTPAEITPAMGAVKLVKTDGGIAWGSLHWQYMEDVSKVTPHEGTPLKVTKSLFVKENTKAGPELRPVTGRVKVGDELVVRLELRTDRDMEFVHLKDQRPSSVEPVNVLSGYKWQDGLGYYESTRDTASHFFFDSLPKGTYVFEYSVRVQLRGKCQTGLAELQCMYAPEFNSHSASAELEVE